MKGWTLSTAHEADSKFSTVSRLSVFSILHMFIAPNVLWSLQHRCCDALPPSIVCWRQSDRFIYHCYYRRVPGLCRCIPYFNVVSCVPLPLTTVAHCTDERYLISFSDCKRLAVTLTRWGMFSDATERMLLSVLEPVFTKRFFLTVVSIASLFEPRGADTVHLHRSSNDRLLS